MLQISPAPPPKICGKPPTSVMKQCMCKTLYTLCKRENDGVFCDLFHSSRLYEIICQGNTIPDKVVQTFTEQFFRLRAASEIKLGHFVGRKLTSRSGMSSSMDASEVISALRYRMALPAPTDRGRASRMWDICGDM